MFKFIKEHWIAYLIGAVIAIAIGFGASYFVGVIGSTPEDASVVAAGSAEGAGSAEPAAAEAEAQQ